MRIRNALTYDDVLLVPNESDVTPDKVDLSTRLTKNISINIPLISAGMDTVTESRMAIAMARQGGIGIIHKNMSIENQAHEVQRVKRSEHGVITDPFFLGPDAMVKEADDLMAMYKISGVPIVDNNRKLLGIITNRDVRFEKDLDRKVSEVMTKDDLIVGPKDRYFQNDTKKFVPEGVEARVPYRGYVGEIIYQLVGGIKSGLGYCGAKDLNDLFEKANFVQITGAGLIESHPHGIQITAEPPNYSQREGGYDSSN